MGFGAAQCGVPRNRCQVLRVQVDFDVGSGLHVWDLDGRPERGLLYVPARFPGSRRLRGFGSKGDLQ